MKAILSTHSPTHPPTFPPLQYPSGHGSLAAGFTDALLPTCLPIYPPTPPPTLLPLQYPSGHGSLAAAFTEALLSIQNGQDNFPFSITSVEGVTRDYTSFSQAREETSISRVYGGDHFRYVFFGGGGGGGEGGGLGVVAWSHPVQAGQSKGGLLLSPMHRFESRVPLWMENRRCTAFLLSLTHPPSHPPQAHGRSLGDPRQGGGGQGSGPL